ncbi:hypothetical protein M2137_001869 [Parabacteroides sp. PFB2-10]|nr:hypothetical protein [Parabacteroides sp. PFB2-10]
MFKPLTQNEAMNIYGGFYISSNATLFQSRCSATFFIET